MLAMAEKKKKKAGRPKTGRSREIGTVRAVGFELPTPLYQELQSFANDERRTKSSVIILALEEFFSARGRWPR